MAQISIGGGISIGAGIILDGGPPPPPPANTILPAITGTAQSGYTLGVSTGTWDNNPTGYTYQWQHGTTNIAGATASTYTLDATYAGETIRCVVTATNAVGSVSATSNPTAAVVAYPVNTVLPVISGTVEVGQTLTASTGTWSNTPTSYSYQWQQGTTDISGATSSTYVIYGAYGGSTIRCKVTATNAVGSATATSASTVPALGVPFITAAAVITGTAAQGQTLSVTTGTWAGTTPITFVYQWQHNNTNISGATSSTYTIDGAYAGETINCIVSATNVYNSMVNTGTYNAGPTATVTPLTPVNSVAPTITGTAQNGQTLTASTGTWTNYVASYTYQWQQGTTNIAGATSSTYVLDATYVGVTIRCVVTATNVTGSASANSASTAAVLPLAPVNSVAPAVTGTAKNTYTLTASTGTWSGSPTFTYQWQQGTTNISGATSSTYLLDDTYVGVTIRCVVTATNAGGSASANTASTAAVLAVPTSGLVLWLDATNPNSGYERTNTVYDISPAAIGGQGWNGNGSNPTFSYANNGYWAVDSNYQQYINVGPYAGANSWTAITIAAWVKIGDTNSTKDIVAKEGLYKLRIDGTSPKVLISNGSGWTYNTTFGSNLSTSTWALVSVTAGTAGVVGYVNTTASVVSGSSFTLGTGASGQGGVQFLVGAYAYNSNNNRAEYYNGGLGSVMTWNRALTSTEITQVYNHGKANYGLS
jgi:hypothetical protein